MTSTASLPPATLDDAAPDLRSGTRSYPLPSASLRGYADDLARCMFGTHASAQATRVRAVADLVDQGAAVPTRLLVLAEKLFVLDTAVVDLRAIDGWVQHAPPCAGDHGARQAATHLHAITVCVLNLPCYDEAELITRAHVALRTLHTYGCPVPELCVGAADACR